MNTHGNLNAIAVPGQPIFPATFGLHYAGMMSALGVKPVPMEVLGTDVSYGGTTSVEYLKLTKPLQFLIDIPNLPSTPSVLSGSRYPMWKVMKDGTVPKGKCDESQLATFSSLLVPVQEMADDAVDEAAGYMSGEPRMNLAESYAGIHGGVELETLFRSAVIFSTMTTPESMERAETMFAQVARLALKGNDAKKYGIGIVSAELAAERAYYVINRHNGAAKAFKRAEDYFMSAAAMLNMYMDWRREDPGELDKHLVNRGLWHIWRGGNGETQTSLLTRYAIKVKLLEKSIELYGDGKEFFVDRAAENMRLGWTLMHSINAAKWKEIEKSLGETADLVNDREEKDSIRRLSLAAAAFSRDEGYYIP